MILAALGLAACSQQVPDSGAGVGFQDYNSYVNGAPPMQAAPVATQPGFSTDGAAAAIDNASAQGRVIGSTTPYQQPTQFADASGARPRGNAPAGIAETTSEMTGIATTVPGTVSDEQDFTAVSARETIESDKARIERNRSRYQVDQPTALPQRHGDAGPNIVEFALSTQHAKGTQMYRRSSLRLTAGNACNRYASPDLAQQAFLGAGGPEKDRKGLDTDGDGYACAWDPTPFRAALQ
jgi:hypothetical protein